MTRNPQRIVGIFGVLLGAWVLTFWLYQPSEPPITYDASPGPMETAPLAAVDQFTALPITPSITTAPAWSTAPSTPSRPALPVQAVEAPRFRAYIVQRGDISFQAISQRVYGTTAHADAVSRANPLVTPDRLVPGRTVLNIPLDPGNIQGRVVSISPTGTLAAETAAATPRTAPAAEARPAEKTYVVQPGDTLSGIAKKVYGSSAQWERLAAANQDRLPDPAKLRAGITLRVPAP